MAKLTYRLPSNAPYGYVEVEIAEGDREYEFPELRLELLKQAVEDLNTVLPSVGAAPAQDARPGAPQAAPAVSNGAQTTCIHGNRVSRSGTSAKGPWTAWFCPQPKGQGECKPEWEKK